MRPATHIIALSLICRMGSCSPPGDGEELQLPQNPGTETGDGNPDEGQDNENMKINIIIDSAVFTATFEKTAASEAFRAMLPMTLEMEDVNRNEKFARLGRSLPLAATNPGTVRSGDLMLWGSDGLVLFYKTFPTSYSYTRLGALDDASDLEAVVGEGTITAIFEPADD